MKWTEAPLKGVWVLEQERREDERGYFARTWCQKEAREHGIEVNWVQSNVSFNRKRGTLRGMHYQVAPHGEPKLVSCAVGRIFDVVVDLREASPTYLKHFSVELDAAKGNALFIPVDFAHGFQTLVDDAVVLYQMGAFFEPGAARGLRFDDPHLNIPWPVADSVILERDLAYPPLATGLLR